MVKIHTLQSNFVTGQIDAAAQARSESALYRNGAASLRNCEPYVTGGVRARRGAWHRAMLTGPAVLVEFAFTLAQSYVAAVGGGRIDFFHTGDGSPAGSVTGLPWDNSQLRHLRFAQLADILWIVHPSHWPIEVKRTGLGSWSWAPMVFDGPRGQPTYRYAPAHITCQAGGGIASELTLSVAPTKGGVAVALVPGMRGQARTTTGPGPWRGFTIASVAGLVIGAVWDVEGGLNTGEALEVQFDTSTAPGTGGVDGGLLTQPYEEPYDDGGASPGTESGTDEGGGGDGAGDGGQA